MLLVVAATMVLRDAFIRSVREGEGTPAPVAPPSRLGCQRVLRFVRNPMYLAVLLVVIGQALILGRLDLWLYAGGDMGDHSWVRALDQGAGDGDQRWP